MTREQMIDAAVRRVLPPNNIVFRIVRQNARSKQWLYRWLTRNGDSHMICVEFKRIAAEQ